MIKIVKIYSDSQTVDRERIKVIWDDSGNLRGVFQLFVKEKVYESIKVVQ